MKLAVSSSVNRLPTTINKSDLRLTNLWFGLSPKRPIVPKYKLSPLSSIETIIPLPEIVEKTGDTNILLSCFTSWKAPDITAPPPQYIAGWVDLRIKFTASSVSLVVGAILQLFIVHVPPILGKNSLSLISDDDMTSSAMTKATGPGLPLTACFIA